MLGSVFFLNDLLKSVFTALMDLLQWAESANNLYLESEQLHLISGNITWKPTGSS